ncbi:unnamed protein product [Closterium sp. Naga37s-1]|nr:unnamed protein product [Closterium sp. Naga37s-1]
MVKRMFPPHPGGGFKGFWGVGGGGGGSVGSGGGAGGGGGGGSVKTEVLAFEIGSVMRRSLEIYDCMGEKTLASLRSNLQAPGVVTLISSDLRLLWNLAGVEKLLELQRVAARVAVLGRKCRSARLHTLGDLFPLLLSPDSDLSHFAVSPAEADSLVKFMKEQAEATERLKSEMEAIQQLHHRIQEYGEWNKLQDMVAQGKSVEKLQSHCLWSFDLDYLLQLIVAALCMIRCRIFASFGPPPSSASPSAPSLAVGSLGAWGLALHYANVVVLLERIIQQPDAVMGPTRDELYDMLPRSIQHALRCQLQDPENFLPDGRVESNLKRGLLLLPTMAHNTIFWQSLHTPGTLMGADEVVFQVQTFYYACKEAVDLALIDVLLGPSHSTACVMCQPYLFQTHPSFHFPPHHHQTFYYACKEAVDAALIDVLLGLCRICGVEEPISGPFAPSDPIPASVSSNPSSSSTFSPRSLDSSTASSGGGSFRKGGGGYGGSGDGGGIGGYEETDEQFLAKYGGGASRGVSSASVEGWGGWEDVPRILSSGEGAGKSTRRTERRDGRDGRETETARQFEHGLAAAGSADDGRGEGRGDGGFAGLGERGTGEGERAERGGKGGASGRGGAGGGQTGADWWEAGKEKSKKGALGGSSSGMGGGGGGASTGGGGGAGGGGGGRLKAVALDTSSSGRMSRSPLRMVTAVLSRNRATTTSSSSGAGTPGTPGASSSSSSSRRVFVERSWSEGGVVTRADSEERGVARVNSSGSLWGESDADLATAAAAAAAFVAAGRAAAGNSTGAGAGTANGAAAADDGWSDSDPLAQLPALEDLKHTMLASSAAGKAGAGASSGGSSRRALPLPLQREASGKEGVRRSGGEIGDWIRIMRIKGRRLGLLAFLAGERLGREKEEGEEEGGVGEGRGKAFALRRRLQLRLRLQRQRQWQQQLVKAR